MTGAIAIIPARGGSKRIDRKNLLRLGGKTLVEHTVLQALAAEEVDEVIVSTEDEEIAGIAAAAGAAVIERPPELADDRATSESALLHVLDERDGPDPELVVFLQVTSPVRRPADIDAAVRQLRASKADSLLSACRDHGFIWAEGPDGALPINYDPKQRPREQDMPQQYRENGSIYVFRTPVLREGGARLGGRVGIYEMDDWSSIQIDEPEDVELAQWILARRPGTAEFPDPIGLVVLDFDGVMTDNTVLVDQDGREAVLANRGDGWGIARLTEAHVPVAVLSTEMNPVVAARCAKLGIPCMQGVPEKATALRSLMAEHGTRADYVIYVGNDVNDLPAMNLAGFPVAVADAHADAIAAARLVLTRPGGHGAVRELCDLILAALDGGETRP